MEIHLLYYYCFAFYEIKGSSINKSEFLLSRLDFKKQLHLIYI